MSHGEGRHLHRVAVVGRGPVFDHRFGSALAAAGLVPVELTVAARSRIDVVIASELDGWHMDHGLPEEADGLPWIVLSNTVNLGVSDDQEVFLLSPRVSAEDLAFALNNALFGSSDRRDAERTMVQMLVRFQVVDGQGDPVVICGELSNLGTDGTFVRSLRPPPTGAEVVLEIVAGDGPEPLLLSGHVVHTIELDLEAGIVCSSEDPGRPVPSHPGFAMVFDPEPSAPIKDRLYRLTERLETGSWSEGPR